MVVSVIHINTAVYRGPVWLLVSLWIKQVKGGGEEDEGKRGDEKDNEEEYGEVEKELLHRPAQQVNRHVWLPGPLPAERWE